MLDDDDPFIDDAPTRRSLLPRGSAISKASPKKQLKLVAVPPVVAPTRESPRRRASLVIAPQRRVCWKKILEPVIDWFMHAFFFYLHDVTRLFMLTVRLRCEAFLIVDSVVLDKMLYPNSCMEAKLVYVECIW
jgi:hypothetical protein